MTLNGDGDLIVGHFDRHQRVTSKSFELLRPQILLTANLIINTLASGSKLIAFGNGGSATQASHLVGELVGRFQQNRRPLPAIALGGDTAVLTCIGNDFGYESLFERQIEALIQPGDVAIGFTTSGKSENVRRGLSMAAKKNGVTVALTGEAGLGGHYAQHILQVPSSSTACIQEVHLMILHMWCFCIDAAFTGTNAKGNRE